MRARGVVVPWWLVGARGTGRLARRGGTGTGAVGGTGTGAVGGTETGAVGGTETGAVGGTGTGAVGCTVGMFGMTTRTGAAVWKGVCPEGLPLPPPS